LLPVFRRQHLRPQERALEASHKGWSIRHRLMLLALAVALPFVLLTAGIMWQLANNERETRREAILFSTRTLMNAVDTVLSKQIAVAQMLATSPALQGDDLAAFRDEARRAMSGLSGGWIVLADETGQQLINLLPGATEPLPRRVESGMKIQRRAFETRQVQISGVFDGALLRSPTVSVELPVFRKEKPPLEIIIGMQPNVFLSLFEQWNLPEGWLAGLIDRDGKFIARSRNHDRNVGKLASEGFRSATRTAAQGWNEMLSLEGATIASAHVTSPLSGWVMGLAAEKSLFEAPIRDTILIAGLAGGGTTLLSLLLAIWSARRIARPIEQIEQGTHALMLRRAISFSNTGLPEADRTLDALAATARVFEQHDKERDEREAHVRLIMRELSHRSKNLLAIVLAIARQTSRHTTSFRDFESRFNSRIQALADAHDLLVEQQWSGAQIDDLVKAQLAAFGVERVTCRGARVLLKAEAVQNVALALHELATNASKYGALSVPAGRINIDWVREPAEAGERNLRLTWQESGGPPVVAPTQKGFGCFVLERVTVNALGEGKLEFNPDGLVWTCIIRPEHLVDEAGDAAPRPAAEAASPQAQRVS
jgi:two-component sensor histidine kinase/type II secretory pathway component PulM